MCTSLLYRDAHGGAYAGRTMELPMELPYVVGYSPVGTAFVSSASRASPYAFHATHAFVSVGVPDPISHDVKIVQGVNDQGLTFALLAFAATDGPTQTVTRTREVLAAVDLGAWTLAQFDSVAAVKEALLTQPILVTALLPFGRMKTPFHYTLHDASGASIVIEFANGQQHVHDNPIGVMTNGPAFPWHLTNLDNYTFLDNRDRSQTQIAGVRLNQPDSGIATVALPASNTSVGRFVRAVYYAHFAETANLPDEAVTTLAHVMNNFDRPRGITIDNRFTSGLANVAAPGLHGHPLYESEYTSWTALTDIRRRHLYLRTYDGMNYVRFDLDAVRREAGDTPRRVALKQVSMQAGDVSSLLSQAV